MNSQQADISYRGFPPSDDVHINPTPVITIQAQLTVAARGLHTGL